MSIEVSDGKVRTFHAQFPTCRQMICRRRAAGWKVRGVLDFSKRFLGRSPRRVSSRPLAGATLGRGEPGAPAQRAFSASGRAAKLEFGRRIYRARLSRRLGPRPRAASQSPPLRRPFFPRSYDRLIRRAHGRPPSGSHLAGADSSRRPGRSGRGNHRAGQPPNDAVCSPLAPRQRKTVGLETRESDERFARDPERGILRQLASPGGRAEARPSEMARGVSSGGTCFRMSSP